MEKDNSTFRIAELTDEQLLILENNIGNFEKMLNEKCKQISRNCGKCCFATICRIISLLSLEIFFEKLGRNIK